MYSSDKYCSEMKLHSVFHNRFPSFESMLEKMLHALLPVMCCSLELKCSQLVSILSKVLCKLITCILALFLLRKESVYLRSLYIYFQTDISSANKLKLSQACMSLISLLSDLLSPTICYCSAERKQHLYFLRKHLHHHRWPGDNRKTTIFCSNFSFMLCLSASLGKHYFRNR